MRQDFILKLPDELLCPILESVVDFSPEAYWRRAHDAQYDDGLFCTVGLLRVCRRFNALAAPLIYSNISIYLGRPCQQKPAPGKEDPVKRLHRAFKRNPSLWHLCRTLKISHDSYASEQRMDNSYITADLATWLTYTTKLSFLASRGGWVETIWPHVQTAVKRMPLLEELTLHDFSYDKINLSDLCAALKDLKSDNLKTIDLCGISKLGGGRALGYLWDMPGTAPFTEIKLNSFLQTPTVLDNLLRWPKRLEKFAFTFPFPADYTGKGLYSHWALSTLHPILSRHRETLKELCIGKLNRSGLNRFSLSDFTGLKLLSLTSDVIENDAVHIANLVAPQLEVFIWDLSPPRTCLRQKTGLHHFGQEHEDWLRALADAFIARQAPLREIRIVFTPHNWMSNFAGDLDNRKYPWDRMDEIADNLRPCGVSVSYNTPTVTKGQFEAELRRAKDDSLQGVIRETDIEDETDYGY